VIKGTALRDLAEQLVWAPGWANGRDVGTWADKTYRHVAMAAGSSTQDQLNVVGYAHLQSALEQLLKHKSTPIPPNKPRLAADELPAATIDSMAMPPPPPAVQTQVKEKDEIEAEETCLPVDGEDEIYAALQLACVELGYDASHEKRIELKGLLRGVQAGEPFPRDILESIKVKTREGEGEIDKALRPQLSPVIASFTAAIEQEEALRAEIARLEAEARAEEARKLSEEEAKAQAKLQAMGKCPAGYAWHRDGCGWRCNGGSHYVGSLPP